MLCTQIEADVIFAYIQRKIKIDIKSDSNGDQELVLFDLDPCEDVDEI